MSHIDNVILFVEDANVKVRDFDPDFNTIGGCKVNATNKLLPHVPPHLERSCGVSDGISKDLPTEREDEKRGYRDK